MDHSLAKFMADSHEEHTKPKCCSRNGILWDLVAIYPAQTLWSDRLPRAVVFDEPGRSYDADETRRLLT
jgi:hypothetical protein